MSFGGYNGRKPRCRDSAFTPRFRAALRGRSTAMAGRKLARNMNVRRIVDASRRSDAWRRVDAWGKTAVYREVGVVETGGKAALRIAKPFLLFGLGLLRVSPAAFLAQFPAMILAAPERAAQIFTARVARMGEEPNPAVFAVHCATGQLGTSLQNGIERDLILTNKRTSTLLLVPILGKRENLPDADYEKARLSAMLSMFLLMPSSYVLDAKAPRGTRVFLFTSHLKTRQPHCANIPRPQARPVPIRCPNRSRSPCALD